MSVSPTSVRAQMPVNVGFERASVEGFSRPWGWTLRSAAEGARFEVDTLVRRSGSRGLRIVRDGGRASSAAHELQHWIAPRFAWGHRVRIRGWTRQEARGRGRLTVEAWGQGPPVADTAWTADDDTDGAWRPLEVSIAVDSTVHSLYVTAALTGQGAVWFDDLSIEADGRTWAAVPAAGAPSSAVTDWLTGRSTPFDRVDASPPDEGSHADLASLERIVGDARVVALGEATHGTSEFFRVKHRVLTTLVERHGFRVFAIEANQLAVEPINRYVRGGSGSLRTLMRAMFAVWNTAEVRDLIEWLRRYNAAHPERQVEFVGFDMQDPSIPIDSVSAFLGRVDPELGHWADAEYAPYRDAWRAGPYPSDTPEARRSWVEAAQRVYERVVAEREEWIAAGRVDEDAATWTTQHANVVRQAALSALTGEFAVRDSAMAENVRWTLARRPPGTRMVIWAHDGHISRAEHEWANYWDGGSMGGWLSRWLGDDYRAFGLMTHAGTYSGWRGAEILEAPLLPAPLGTLEHALHVVAERLRSPLLVSDIRDPERVAIADWLDEPRYVRMLGYAAEDVGFATGISVGRQFDGIIFVDRTTPSRVLRAAPTREPAELSCGIPDALRHAADPDPIARILEHYGRSAPDGR